MQYTQEQINRFWNKTTVTGSGCIVWTGYCIWSGYGRVFIHGRAQLAHRVSYEIANGEIENDDSYHGTVIAHTCDNVKCVNPTHLVAMTQRENIEDCMRKDRKFKPKGEKNIKAKLLEAQVKDIRNSLVDVKTLAKNYGVTVSTIAAIKTGKTWNHI